MLVGVPEIALVLTDFYQETRTSLDQLAEEMRRSRPDDWIDHQLVWTDIDAQDRDAEITEALEEYAAEQAGTEQEEVIQQAEGEEQATVDHLRG